MNNILSMLGFSKKAGKLVAGSNAVVRSILQKRSFLIIVTTDAGKSVKEKFMRLASENEVKYVVFSTSCEVEKATGEQNKVIYSIEDENFANKIICLLQ